ncbi:unnamed protein product [Closterium sp. NIES-64]|nr:unnamed protein product [Closterium sp. NIES-64]
MVPEPCSPNGPLGSTGSSGAARTGAATAATLLDSFLPHLCRTHPPHPHPPLIPCSFSGSFGSAGSSGAAPPVDPLGALAAAVQRARTELWVPLLVETAGRAEAREMAGRVVRGVAISCCRLCCGKVRCLPCLDGSTPNSFVYVDFKLGRVGGVEVREMAGGGAWGGCPAHAADSAVESMLLAVSQWLHSSWLLSSNERSFHRLKEDLPPPAPSSSALLLPCSSGSVPAVAGDGALAGPACTPAPLDNCKSASGECKGEKSGASSNASSSVLSALLNASAAAELLTGDIPLAALSAVPAGRGLDARNPVTIALRCWRRLRAAGMPLHSHQLHLWFLLPPLLQLLTPPLPTLLQLLAPPPLPRYSAMHSPGLPHPPSSPSLHLTPYPHFSSASRPSHPPCLLHLPPLPRLPRPHRPRSARPVPRPGVGRRTAGTGAVDGVVQLMVWCSRWCGAVDGVVQLMVWCS